jgi:hypothetical protein
MGATGGLVKNTIWVRVLFFFIIAVLVTYETLIFRVLLSGANVECLISGFGLVFFLSLIIQGIQLNYIHNIIGFIK